MRCLPPLLEQRVENNTREIPYASPGRASVGMRSWREVSRGVFRRKKPLVQIGAVFAAMRLFTADPANPRIMLDTFVALRALATLATDVGIEL